MANEFKITDIVSKSALDQLDNLTSKFNSTAQSYSDMAKILAGGVKIEPKTIQELSDKQENYQKVLKELIETQNKLSDIQKEHSSLLKEIEEQTKKNVKQILEEAKANKLNADAEYTASKTETERLKQQRLLNQEKKKLEITTEEAIALMGKEVHSIREAKEQNKLLRLAVSQVTDAEDKDNNIRQMLNNQIAKNTEYIRFNSDAYTKQKMAIGSYKNEIKAALVELQNGNRTFKNLGVVAKGFGGILKTNVVSGLNEVRIGVGSMIKGMVGAQAVIGGIQRFFGLIKSGIGSIVDFEAANSKLAAILGTTSKNMKDLIADAQRLGATTKYTASEATNLQIELAKLGFSRKEILQSTEAILKFAQATGADLPEAAALAGASLRMFDADTRETERYVSAMAVATTKSALSFSYLQTAMPIVGPVAKAFNFQIEDTLALLGKLADAGFDASMSATATRNIFLNLADSGGALAKSLGGPVKTLPELVAGLQKLKEQGIDLNTTLKLTDKRSVAAFNAFLTASDKIVPLREQITGVTGELNDMAKTMGDNVQGAIASLSSAWEAFMLSFYESKGVMKDVINFFARGIRGVADQLKSYSQLQDKSDNIAVARAQKEMATSDILERHRKNMSRLYKEKLNEGMSQDEAAIAAKEEYLQALQSQLEFENSSYRIAIQQREKEEEELNKRGLIYFRKNTERTNKQIKENIETLTKVASGKKAIASITESVIEDLNEVDLKSAQVSGNVAKILTDKEKRKLEKAAREKLKIQQAYQESELSLMDDGLEKGLAKIRYSFNKRIAAIKGNSEEETATRENLAEQMQRELDKYEFEYNINKEKERLKLRLESVEKDSKEEYDLKMELLVLERQMELNQDNITQEERLLILDKYEKKRNDLLQSYSAKILKHSQDTAAGSAAILSSQMQEELDILAKSYTQGEIDKEAYERKKYEITERYAIKQMRNAIDLSKKQLEIPDLSPDDELKLQQKIAEAEIALNEKVRDSEIKAAEDAENAWRKKLDSISEKIQTVGEILNSFSELSSAIFDRKIQEIEEEQEANEKAGDEEIARIERLEEVGVITKEDAEARKREAEKRTAQKEEELAKKKAELQEKQAKWDKANSINQAIIATALGVTKALPNLVLAAIVSAMGAVQLATIVAQPIPKYAKGTDNHPGGLAIVGDGGKNEAILTDKGTYITPSVPTLVDIPQRAVVIPDIVNIDSFKYMRSDVEMLMRNADKKREPVTVNVNNDYSRLEKKTDSLIVETRNLSKHLKNLSKNAEWHSIASRL